MRLPFFTIRAAAAIAGVAALAACEANNDPAGMTGVASSPARALLPTGITGQPDGVPSYEHFEVCKYGSSATFDVSAYDYNTSSSLSPQPFTVADQACVLAAAFDRYGADVTVTETAPQAGFQFDSVWVYITDENAGSSSYKLTTATVTEFVAGQLGGRRGVVAKYYNSAIPTGGGEGCTPGYWKQPQHFDSWTGYAPTDLFSSVFEDAFPGMTLLQVLSQGGGGLNALGRHTVAALLNTASAGVDYDMTTQGVIDAFNAVYPGGDYEGQKNIFAGYNELGCPLN